MMSTTLGRAVSAAVNATPPNPIENPTRSNRLNFPNKLFGISKRGRAVSPRPPVSICWISFSRRRARRARPTLNHNLRSVHFIKTSGRMRVTSVAHGHVRSTFCIRADLPTLRSRLDTPATRSRKHRLHDQSDRLAPIFPDNPSRQYSTPASD